MLEVGQYQTRPPRGQGREQGGTLQQYSRSLGAHGVPRASGQGQKFVDPVQILGKVAQGVVA
ncbi:hypothetical protein, partial [Comamonas thiooxydans]|uniref:hypothetical protein n=1 Tax=Comamonas thiooxydans TaxID=363952 RepID=UPI001C0F0729